ncbi:hypothetical protein GOQ27_07160 [Clostridium sp. D2Q-11]|uniref:Uncharacterized protein n=1 Tax=Anaeromonas frigoriresistens TaxID=2683708 RepID=A0A942Z690_9FIRM|nr:hypothetical protein [Anaeromonas frigoriresistens]MBS4538236.1 hypothetical protein [Anaeromonas frigoriresistens]
MKKWIIYLILILLYILITFFGLGPVLLADGSMNERIITLLIVIGLYAVVTVVFRKIIDK